MPTDPKDADWRDMPSPVTAIKAAYRSASKRQRQQILAWFLRHSPRSSRRKSAH